MKRIALIFLALLLAVQMAVALADPIACAVDAPVYDTGADGTVHLREMLPAGTPFSVISPFRPEKDSPYSDYFAAEIADAQPLLFHVSYTFDGGYYHEGVMLERDIRNQLITEHRGSSAAIGSFGYVLCQTLSVREEPDDASRAIDTFHHGLTFAIWEINGAWYRVNYQETTGWVNGEYVLINPEYLATQGRTVAYAYPSQDALRVGLIDANTQLAIIADLPGYYCVSLRGASAFIRK